MQNVMQKLIFVLSFDFLSPVKITKICNSRYIREQNAFFIFFKVSLIS